MPGRTPIGNSRQRYLPRAGRAGDSRLRGAGSVHRGQQALDLARRSLEPELAGEFVTKTLFLAINRQGTPFFWPVRLPAPDGRDLDWWRSSREAAELAMKSWVRVRANMNLGAYDLFVAESAIPDPEWPTLGFWELIKIAFRDHLIDRVDHPVIARLRGQV
jgi:hypothetical protein